MYIFDPQQSQSDVFIAIYPICVTAKKVQVSAMLHDVFDIAFLV